MTFPNQQNSLNRPIALSNIIWIIIVLLLAAGIIFMTFRYWGISRELTAAQAQAKNCQFSGQTVDFTKMFVAKVLSADKEVDFETRLQLETEVRNLKDSQILEAWNKFTNSQSEAEAQDQVKALLTVLLEKIK